MHPEERQHAERYIFEMASGYFGWTEENIKRADAIEIKIGQAAKASVGGLLPGDKVIAEIATVRGIQPGETAHSPVHFPDINSPQDLANRVREIRQITGGKPVGIKFAASKLEEDLEATLIADPDWITIDGRPGAAAAAPVHLKDHVGMPTVYAVDRTRRFFDTHRVRGVDLIVTGGLRTPADVAKATASMSTPASAWLPTSSPSCANSWRTTAAFSARTPSASFAVEDLITVDSEISNHTSVEHA